MLLLLLLRWLLLLLGVLLLGKDEAPDLGLSLLAGREADGHVRRVCFVMDLHHLRWEILAQGHIPVHHLHTRRDVRAVAGLGWPTKRVASSSAATVCAASRRGCVEGIGAATMRGGRRSSRDVVKR